MSDEKVYRNIQEQVLKNAQDIAKLKNLGGGVIGIQGPQGPRGFAGRVGPVGPQGSIWTISTSEPSNPRINDIWLQPNGVVKQYNGGSWITKTDIRGPQGMQGIQGIQGPRGLTGPIGPVGPQGPIGENFIIKGPVSTTSNLPDPISQPAQTAYLVGSSAPYLLYVISDGQWINAGSFASLDNIQVIVIDAPDNATEGTLTDDQVNRLANNDCVLVLGYEVYHKTENHEEDGYWEYASFDSSYIKIITVMTAGSWVKNIFNNNFIPDNALDLNSAEPVENRVITAKFNEHETQINANNTRSLQNQADLLNRVKYSEVESELNSNSVLPVQNKIVSRTFSLLEDDIDTNKEDINAIKSILFFYVYNNNGYLYVDYLTNTPNFSINENGELIYEGDLNLSRSANNIILTF